jgi:hypothetical protein
MSEKEEPVKEWEFDTAEERPDDLEILPFTGTRKEAVREAKELTDISGTKVYVQPKGARFIPKK